MATLPCPFCGHALVTNPDERPDRCPSCANPSAVAYRYRLLTVVGDIAGGVLYEAEDGGFGRKVGVIFAADLQDKAAVARFLGGHRLFAEVGGRGLTRVYDVSSPSDPRPYVVVDWLEGGTLEERVTRGGALPQAELFELVDDLLAGLGKAHRSMPPIVHGNIHPGKIGFRSQSQTVLFGFEWAQRTDERASTLADTFIESVEVKGESGRVRDLRQLGVAIYYAATAEWLGDTTGPAQVARVRDGLPGPVGALASRMIAGEYRSALEATLDLDRLLTGDASWRQRPEHSGKSRNREVVATPRNAETPDYYEEDEEDEDEDDFALPEILASAAPGRRQGTAPERASESSFDAARQRQLQQQLKQQQLQSTQGGRRVLFAVIGLGVFGTCVAGVLADLESSDPPPPPASRPALPRSEPVEVPEFEPVEMPQFDEPAAASEQRLSGNHHYTGRVTGPAQLVGLELGDLCSIWVEPNESSRLNCRWYIDCGEPARRIYGGGTAGFSSCEVVDGHPVFAADEDDDTADGAFVAEFRGDTWMLMVVDRWLLPPVEAMISVDAEGGPAPGSVENVDAPLRLSDADIERALSGLPLEDEDDDEAQDADGELGLSRADLRESLRSVGLESCPVDRGVDVTVSFLAHPDGHASNITVTPAQSAAAETCVVDRLGLATFRNSADTPKQVTWTFSAD